MATKTLSGGSFCLARPDFELSRQAESNCLLELMSLVANRRLTALMSTLAMTISTNDIALGDLSKDLLALSIRDHTSYVTDLLASHMIKVHDVKRIRLATVGARSRLEFLYLDTERCLASSSLFNVTLTISRVVSIFVLLLVVRIIRGHRPLLL
jgi:hypothetical protein